MSKKPDLQPDLFAWADSRPSAVVIDAKTAFAYRRMSYDAQVVLELFVPPPVTGTLIVLADRAVGKRANKGRAA